jgi:hypothetical protein
MNGIFLRFNWTLDSIIERETKNSFIDGPSRLNLKERINFALIRLQMIKKQENILNSSKLRGLNSKAFNSGSGELKEKLDTTI